MRHGRVLASAALAALLTVGAVACSGGDEGARTPSTTTTTTVAEPKGALPPASALELEPMYGAALAEIGLKLTDRGGLIDRSGGGYAPSGTGHHLALYVEPIGERTVAQYLDGIRDIPVVFSDVFDRWPGLASYDVCQEPVADDGDPTTEPLPVTQIELTKEQASAFDWATVTTEELVRSSREEPPGIELRVSTEMVNDPAFKAVAGDVS